MINKTTNYDAFNFYPSNRRPFHWPKIAESIKKKDLTPWNPILVSEDFFIIDGQGRFLACKSLGLPIYYTICPVAEENDIIILNVGRTDWTPQNYLDFFCQQGNQHYLLVSDTLQKYPNLQIMDILRIYQVRAGELSTSETFKTGQYKFNDEAVKRCASVSRIISYIEKYVPKKEFRHRTSLISAISSIVYKEIDINRLILQIQKNPYLFRAQPDMINYLENLETIYNYRMREKISFKY